MKSLGFSLIYLLLLQLVAFQALADSYQDVYCESNGRLMARNGAVISQDFKSVADCNGLLSLLRRQAASTTYLNSRKNRDLTIGFLQATSFSGIGFPQKLNCEVKSQRYHLTHNKDGYITPECTPEVLYSWGGFDKLNWFVNNLGNSKWPHQLPRSLFTTSSAAATFGYGPVAIRIKVKPSVRFRLVVSPSGNTCEHYISEGYLTSQNLSNTIIARLDLRDDGLSFMEYAICSGGVIESWSYGMPEHFDEILRDHHWMTTKHFYQWEAYAKRNGVDKYLDNDLDTTSTKYKAVYSLEVLQARIGMLRALTNDGFGQVLAPSAQARARHFRITKPNYFLRSVP